MAIHFANFTSRQKKSAYAVGITRGSLEGRWFRTGLLNAAQASVGIDMMQHSGPGFIDHRLVHFFIQNSFIDACRQGINKEGRAGDLRLIVVCWIKQAGSPRSEEHT